MAGPGIRSTTPSSERSSKTRSCRTGSSPAASCSMAWPLIVAVKSGPELGVAVLQCCSERPMSCAALALFDVAPEPQRSCWYCGAKSGLFERRSTRCRVAAAGETARTSYGVTMAPVIGRSSVASPFVGGLPREDDLIGQHAEPLGQPRHRADECRHHADQRATIADQHRPKRPILIGAVSARLRRHLERAVNSLGTSAISSSPTSSSRATVTGPPRRSTARRSPTPSRSGRATPRDVRFWA